MLYFYDQEFPTLFKVKAEIRPVIDADRQAAGHYASHVGALARRENLPDFDGAALKRIVEFGMRMAGDRDRVLSMMSRSTIFAASQPISRVPKIRRWSLRRMSIARSASGCCASTLSRKKSAG